MLNRKKAQEASKPVAEKLPPKKAEASPSLLEESSLTEILNSSAIEEYAYYLWEKEGKPEGRNLEFWLKAEKEFLSKTTKK